jgi:putative tricarboxylic transport membrane protein
MKRPIKLSETLLPAILLVVAVLVFISISRLQSVMATADLVGSKMYPMALAVLLAILSGLLLLGAAPPHGGNGGIKLPGIVRRFIPLVLFSALYVFAMPSVGFIISTTALLMACFYLLGERKLWLNFVVAAGCTVATYLLFVTLLGVQLSAFPG